MSLPAVCAAIGGLFGAFAFLTGYVVGHDAGYQQARRRRWP